MLVAVGIAMGIGIETIHEKFGSDSDPDPEQAAKVCTATI
jgi:hypothetical protein